MSDQEVRPPQRRFGLPWPRRGSATRRLRRTALGVALAVLLPVLAAGAALRLEYTGDPDPAGRRRGRDAVWLGLGLPAYDTESMGHHAYAETVAASASRWPGTSPGVSASGWRSTSISPRQRTIGPHTALRGARCDPTRTCDHGGDHPRTRAAAPVPGGRRLVPHVKVRQPVGAASFPLRPEGGAG